LICSSLSFSLVDFLSFSSDIEFKHNDVTIFHFVVFALLFIKALGLDGLFSSKLVQVSVLHDFCADETTFEVSVNGAGALGCFPAISDSPALNLILPSGEEVNQAQRTVSYVRNFADHRGGT